jgi:hypothetical protein
MRIAARWVVLEDMLVIATWLLAGSLLLGQSASASKESLENQVRDLTRQLKSPLLVSREEAQQKLIALGPGVLEFLPVPTEDTAAEERQRLGQIRDKLQRAQAESSVKATSVTLQGEMKLSEVFAAMQKQTGNTIVDQRENLEQQGGDPTVKVDFQQIPFWQALDQLMDQQGLTVYPYIEQDAVGFQNRPEGDLPRSQRPVSYAGAFRLEGMELLAKRNLRNSNDLRLQMMVEVAWEPRLDPITIQQRMSDIKAVDDAGNAIELENTESVLEPQILPGDLTTEMLVPLKLPDRGVKQIASLKGKLTAMVPGRVETFRFTNLAGRGVEQRKAGVAVILDQIRRNNEIWEIRVLIRFDKAAGALESHRGWVFNNEAYLENKDGQRINYDGFETTRQTEQDVGMAYYFDLERGPQGLTFVYKTPSVVTMLPVEYEIKNLPLP